VNENIFTERREKNKVKQKICRGSLAAKELRVKEIKMRCFVGESVNSWRGD
jgi:hypothetical protein